MSTTPQTDVNAARISDQTERVLHDLVRDAACHLSEELNDPAHQSAPTFEDEIRFERGADGHFRERKKRVRRLWPILTDEWLLALPDFQRCVALLKSDVVIGPHLDHLVGTRMRSSHLEAIRIVKSLIYAMLDDEAALTFTCEKFHSKWQELADFFGTDRIAHKMVARFQIWSPRHSHFG